MTNQMIGAREEYDLRVKYAMRITSSGEFLHAAPWNAAYFGRRNASHGCVGMSTGDAAWLFNRTLIGDPVVTTGTSRRMEHGNGYSRLEHVLRPVQEGLSALGSRRLLLSAGSVLRRPPATQRQSWRMLALPNGGSAAPARYSTNDLVKASSGTAISAPTIPRR